MKYGFVKVCSAFLACISVVSLSACGNKNNLETTAAVSGSTTKAATQSQFDAKDSEEELRQLLASQTKDEVLAFSYDDYDKDGKHESFAFTGTENKIEAGTTYEGVLWYVKSDSAKKLMEKDEYWEVCKKLDFDKRSCCVMEKYYTTGSISFVWGVKNGEAKEEVISGKVNGLNIENGILLGTQSAYDLTFDKESKTTIGHTWKSYYFYDDNGIKEYGGKIITETEFLKFQGASGILNDIKNGGRKVTNIIYRANGIININCSAETDTSIDYSNVKVKYVGNRAELLESSDTEGTYLAALVPEIAVFPN